ncbi:MAG: enoyl-[acyl-carrier-protein] reductase [Myxococcales bacterium]|nr:enoyl-[acyl-carrier-protein] reductase [Myxococcales bacterium]
MKIDLAGKRAFVAGVADDQGFGFAIAKCLAEAGAEITIGTWPPAYSVFIKLLERGRMSKALEMSDGSTLKFQRIYPLDAEFDTLQDVPEDIRENRRYKDRGDFSIQGVSDALRRDFGEKPIDIVVHSLANAPEVKNALLRTSRKGYLRAISASSYSNVSLVQRMGPLMRQGGSFVSLTYLASDRVVPGYGGGMSSAKAALECDTRVLAYEAGHEWGLRVNCISAGPWASRAASAIGFIENMVAYNQRNAPLPERLKAEEVGATAAFLASSLGSGITGTTVYVDKGYHVMGMALDAVPSDLDTPQKR